MNLYFIKAGDEANNADWFVWATDMDQAITLWREASGFEVFDRAWVLPATPPVISHAVAWASMTSIAGRYNLEL